MNQTDNIAQLNKAFRQRYTDAFVRKLAASGNGLLTNIERHEDFTGAKLLLKAADGTNVLLSRCVDYERPQFAPNREAMFKACDEAIKRLGARLNECLSRERGPARTFMGEAVRSEMHPATWAGGSALHSLGPAPQALGDDGIYLMRIAKSGHSGSDDTMPQYREDRLEARFGYYANIGPRQTAGDEVTHA